MHKKLSGFLAAIVLLPNTAVFAAGTDDLLETTTKIEMPGMSMPTQTAQVCVAKGKASDGMMPQDGDCKMTDFKHSGNKSTFKITCTSPEPMTGTAEFVNDGPNASHGKMHMVGKADGQSVDMTTTYSSKRIGSCTYEDPGKKAKDQMEALSASACRSRMDEFEWQTFIGKYASEYCKPYRNEFCGRVSKFSDKMRDPANYNPKNKNWKDAAEACGQSTDAVLKEACGRAVGSKNWDFVADNCPAEGKNLAQQYCEGRDYTTQMTSSYAPICGKYGSVPAEKSPTKYSKLPSGDSVQDTAKKDGASQVLDMGTKALKGLLNF